VEALKAYKKHWILGLLTLIVAIMFIPTGDYIEGPGLATDIGPMVTLKGEKEFDDKGSLNLTAVSFMKANIGTEIYAWLTPFTDILSQQEMTGGVSDDDYNRINQYYMETAQNMAVQKGFELADKPFKLEFKGVYVLQITDNSPFKGVLNIGDTLTQVDGRDFESSKDLVAYVSSQKVGNPVTIRFTSDGTQKTATAKYIKLASGKTGIGIGLTDHTAVESDPEVKIDAGNIGGPSAGMMFTLQVYEELTHKDLTKGRKIAGTGTIDSDGTVGRIGGIDKKVATAAKEGATIFLAPDDDITADMKKADPSIKSNYQEALAAAKKAKTDMTIVPVKTVQDALDYLEK
jgi:PDZ domain-containing protein